jgi:hypothetical protein
MDPDLFKEVDEIFLLSLVSLRRHSYGADLSRKCLKLKTQKLKVRSYNKNKSNNKEILKGF